MCTLLTELTESNKQHSECQNEVKTTTASLFTELPLIFNYCYIYLKMGIKSESI